jgi:LmbE family N-acetylglucosaminyl deacetylase
MIFGAVIILLLPLLFMSALQWPAAKRVLRRCSRAAIIPVLRCRSRSINVQKEINSVLILSPHQDDEILGCGGLIATLREQKKPVSVVFLTDGRSSHAGHPTLRPDKLAILRSEEARRALAVLGVPPENIHFLGAPDGELPRLTPEQKAKLVSAITALVHSLKPQIVLLPSQLDGSSEHVAGYEYALEALRHCDHPPRVWEFPVWAWWSPRLLAMAAFKDRRVFRFSFNRLAGRKALALADYRSQIEPTPPWTDPVLPPDFVAAFSGPDEFFFER